jgi:hypothetical protein
MSRLVRSLSLSFLWASSLMLLLSAAQAQICPAPTNPNVTTWHNDYCRTGWQQNEYGLPATGTNAVSLNNFGLVAQWNSTSGAAMGAVDAQPLAVSGLQGVQGQNGQTCQFGLCTTGPNSACVQPQ